MTSQLNSCLSCSISKVLILTESVDIGSFPACFPKMSLACPADETKYKTYFVFPFQLGYSSCNRWMMNLPEHFGHFKMTLLPLLLGEVSRIDILITLSPAGLSQSRPFLQMGHLTWSLCISESSCICSIKSINNTSFPSVLFLLDTMCMLNMYFVRSRGLSLTPFRFCKGG